MAPPLTGISSMATRLVLEELARAFEQRTNRRVAFESVGGVDAAKRVQAGEAFDVVVLAANAIEQLGGAGRLVPDSRVDLVRSEVAIAVRAGAQRPDVATEAALKQAVLAAGSLGYSTGPSGVQLTRLFERWGIAEKISARLKQAPPGIPVGALVASGEVELGFQQYSELMHLPGIDVLGTMPAEVNITTVFSGAICATSQQIEAARELLRFLASPEVEQTKHRCGMRGA